MLYSKRTTAPQRPWPVWRRPAARQSRVIRRPTEDAAFQQLEAIARTKDAAGKRHKLTDMERMALNAYRAEVTRAREGTGRVYSDEDFTREAARRLSLSVFEMQGYLASAGAVLEYRAALGLE